MTEAGDALNYSVLFALQLCCWVEDLNFNGLGSRQGEGVVSV